MHTDQWPARRGISRAWNACERRITKPVRGLTASVHTQLQRDSVPCCAPAHWPRLARQRRALEIPRDLASRANVCLQLQPQRTADAQLDRLGRDGQRHLRHAVRTRERR